MNWQGIDITKVRGGKTICPKCSHDRKHKNDPCLSVNVQEGVWNCHNCGFSGSAKERMKKEYTTPPPRLEKVSEKSLSFFEGRGISNNTLLRFGITEAKEWMPQFEAETPVICFNYYRDDKLINIKYRGPKKSFKMVSGAELIFYNLDSLKDEKSCVIVEGEIDCLSMYEANIYNSISVPNGASKGSQKLEYLDNCWQYFEGMDKVILAVDNDEPGLNLRDELARRIGKEKCYTVNYPEGCKDANEVLLKFGKEAIQEMVDNAKEWPLEGIKTMDEMFPTVDSWYNEGYPKGACTKIDGFDKMLTFAPGQLTIVTGIPGHGKDEFTNYIMASLSKHEDWSWGICGFEETPEQTVTKLIEKFIGKAFDFRKNPYNRVSQMEYEKGVGMVDKYFSFINTDDIDTDIDGILSVAELLVKKRGIKGLYINPWNWIEHKRPTGMSETEYVSEALTKIIRFAKKRDVHVFLLAHTTKMYKDKQTGKYDVPTLYSISGSAHFFNKTHNGITVYRDYQNKTVDIYVQKVKQSWLGQTGFSTYTFNPLTRQYNFQSTSIVEHEESNWIPIKLIEPDNQDAPF